ncbi:MAG: hypothetical protein EXR92_02420 [Gemmatimonadetes bacterium]|nr:hypothetical protein [Gemmatimonadota bacterium]
MRPPAAGITRERSVDAWIDLNRTIQALLRRGRFVLVTDDAVGSREEESLQHVTTNLGQGADLSRVIPFLTLKHGLDYCLLFARRAASHGLGALTITGGDLAVGLPRCVPRSRTLRKLLREQAPGLPLGAWVNPHRKPEEQVELLLDPEHEADYFLTQVVSHHDLSAVDRFLNEAARRGLTTPGLFGVFFYRSANPHTLEKLGRFMPVPRDALEKEFGGGATPEEVCARTLEALARRGVPKVYVSNLAVRGADERLQAIESLIR